MNELLKELQDDFNDPDQEYLEIKYENQIFCDDPYYELKNMIGLLEYLIEHHNINDIRNFLNDFLEYDQENTFTDYLWLAWEYWVEKDRDLLLWIIQDCNLVSWLDCYVKEGIIFFENKHNYLVGSN